MLIIQPVSPRGVVQMVVNLLRELQEFGQSLWLDARGRVELHGGELARLIDGDGVSGVTCKIGVFQQAVAADPGYRADIRRLHASGATPRQILEQLMLRDVRAAADELHRVYRRSDHHDGFVSVQVAPLSDGDGAVAEAKRLWLAIDRSNAMIEVPATPAGLPVIRRLIAEGINVNAISLFGLARYREVLDAFAAGLEERRAAGGSLTEVAAVASVFVHRIDARVDDQLCRVHAAERASRARGLIGKAGTETARFAYQDYKKFLASPRWVALAAAGASPQRLLWNSANEQPGASSELRYIDELIGRDTVSAVPMATLTAYRDRGRPAPRLEHDLYDTALLPSDLLGVGIDLERLSRQLEAESADADGRNFEALLSSVAALT